MCHFPLSLSFPLSDRESVLRQVSCPENTMILPKSRHWIPFCLTLALLSQGAVMGEGVITQVPSLVTGTEGQSVTLNCTVRDTSAGAARWSRDTGRGRQLFFSTGSDIRDPRVSFILVNHPTDKSIRIDNLTLGDSGVYYCDKYRPGPSSEIAIPGPGVTLTVTVAPLPKISKAASVNHTVTLTCSVQGYYPMNISITWSHQGGAAELKGNPLHDGTFSAERNLSLTLQDRLTVNCTAEVLGLNLPKTSQFVLDTQKSSGPDSTRESETQPSVIVVSVVTVGVILVLLVAMVVWRCSHHQKTGGQKGDVRPEDAIKHTSTEDAEVTYARLSLSSNPPRHAAVPPAAEACVYAQVGGRKPEGTARGTGVTPEEVTYAGLDQSRLNQGRRKRQDNATQYQETEYASVNIRK
ncbi:uncharacterized protein [Lepisosteus oculatus]|uniref:uncharacterized protein isoform X3 n=1 Tax=Lepisosteus oculatus TaxID=7918 RepID=UPI00371903B7